MKTKPPPFIRRHGFLVNLFILVAVFCLATSLPAADRMVVHEWGTFTSLQDEHGEAIGAINSDDEPVPHFVSRLWNVTAVPVSDLTPAFEGKAIMRNHPDVTMRLETPVIYFYPPPGRKTPTTVDVKVDFHGGWLTEFYPSAKGVAPGLTESRQAFPPLNMKSQSSLEWKGLQVGVTGKPVATTDPVWITPREVGSALVRNAAGTPNPRGADEVEKYLFYRGVGHINSPLRVTTSGKGGGLSIWHDLPRPADGSTVAGSWCLDDIFAPMAWLVEIRRDGKCAFRSLDSLTTPPSATEPNHLATVPFPFAHKEFGNDRLAVLTSQMRKALVAEGLFEDEASAMLKTWELSYFKSPGVRLFHITRRMWNNSVLPLKISGDPEIKRVMVGRIELVTKEQKSLLAKIAAGPCPDLTMLKEEYRAKMSAQTNGVQWDDLLHGRKSLADLGVAVPPLYQAYLDLGRFRNALVLHEQKVRPAPALAQFIQGTSL